MGIERATVGLEVYYAADIRNALLAAEQAVGATAEAAGERDEPFTAGFLTGYRAALTTLALAFGLACDESQGQLKDSAFHPESYLAVTSRCRPPGHELPRLRCNAR